MSGRSLPISLLLLCGVGALLAAGLLIPGAGKTGEPQWLGMEVEPLTANMATALGVPARQRGVFVSDVVGIAADAGVAEGDVIVALNGTAIDGTDAFDRGMHTALRQGSAEMVLLRRGQTITIRIPFASPPSPDAPAALRATPAALQATWQRHFFCPNRPPCRRAALASPPCATCPNAAACLPPAGPSTVALAPPPGCATCPNAATCLPPAGQLQPAALLQRRWSNYATPSPLAANPLATNPLAASPLAASPPAANPCLTCPQR